MANNHRSAQQVANHLADALGRYPALIARCIKSGDSREEAIDFAESCFRDVLKGFNVAELLALLDEEGVRWARQPKRADVVEMVSDLFGPKAVAHLFA